MKFSPKYILTAGYILGFINIGSLILGIGWIMLGNKFKQKVWFATGILGIIAFATLLLNAYNQIINVFSFAIPFSIPKFDNDVNLYYALVVTFIAFYILQLISLWTASADFETGLIRVSSILFGVNFILFFFNLTNLVIAVIASVLCAAGFYLLKEKKKKIGLVSPQF